MFYIFNTIIFLIFFATNEFNDKFLCNYLVFKLFFDYFDEQLVTPEATDSQQILIHLINALKCITADTLVHTVHQVVKQASIFEQVSK